MSKKFKPAAPIVVLVAALVVAGLILLRGRDYGLNRTVRRVALRLVQVETLSRTTQVDYRVVFWNNRCVVESLDPESGQWLPSASTAYDGDVVSDPAGIRIRFSGGRFVAVELPGGHGRTPRFVILEFRIPGSSKKRGIIFHENGDWRILG